MKFEEIKALPENNTVIVSYIKEFKPSEITREEYQLWFDMNADVYHEGTSAKLKDRLNNTKITYNGVSGRE